MVDTLTDAGDSMPGPSAATKRLVIFLSLLTVVIVSRALLTIDSAASDLVAQLARAGVSAAFLLAFTNGLMMILPDTDSVMVVVMMMIMLLMP